MAEFNGHEILTMMLGDGTSNQADLCIPDEGSVGTVGYKEGTPGLIALYNESSGLRFEDLVEDGVNYGPRLQIAAAEDSDMVNGNLSANKPIVPRNFEAILNKFFEATLEKYIVNTLVRLGVLVDTDAEYTCSKYNHQAIIEGYLADKYGFASGEIITEDELGKCEIDVVCEDYSGSHEDTLSLEGARVITLEGGYALSVAVSYGCPDARVIVVTDTEAFNRMCSCDLEATGIYLSYTQVDNDALQITLTTKVTALRTTALKVSNDYLYLEGHPYIKYLESRIRALEK